MQIWLETRDGVIPSVVAGTDLTGTRVGNPTLEDRSRGSSYSRNMGWIRTRVANQREEESHEGTRPTWRKK